MESNTKHGTRNNKKNQETMRRNRKHETSNKEKKQ